MQNVPNAKCNCKALQTIVYLVYETCFTAYCVANPFGCFSIKVSALDSPSISWPLVLRKWGNLLGSLLDATETRRETSLHRRRQWHGAKMKSKILLKHFGSFTYIIRTYSTLCRQCFIVGYVYGMYARYIALYLGICLAHVLSRIMDLAHRLELTDYTNARTHTSSEKYHQHREQNHEHDHRLVLFIRTQDAFMCVCECSVLVCMSLK